MHPPTRRCKPRDWLSKPGAPRSVTEGMKVLTRYLLRSHLGPLVFAFVALTGVVLINTLARSLASLAGKGLPTHVFFEFFLLSLPANIALTLPMSVLVAVLYAFSQMAEENEITAIRASGVDLRRMVMPVIACAAMLAGFMVWFNDQVLPAANYRWRMLMMDVAQTSPLISLRPRVVNPIPTTDGVIRYYLRAARIDPATNRLWDVTIYDLSGSDVSRTIYADSGRVALNEAKTDMILRLYDGSIREVQLNQPESFQQALFTQQVLRMQGISQQLARTKESGYRTDRDMTVAMMGDTVDSLRTQLQSLLEKKDIPIPPSAGVQMEVDENGEQISYQESRARSLRFQIREYEVEIQKKFSIAVSTLVFVLIGVPVALRFPRGGIGMVIAVSLAVFSIYYVGLIGGETLGNEGYVPAWLGMWSTNLIFGAIGLFGLWRLGREQSTGRSGGWGDLPRWLKFSAFRRSENTAEV
jgi:lipopolysaccharide export system permease protein